jgi:hypothetical protein
VEFFCRSMRCTPDTEVTRIEFRYVPDDTGRLVAIPGTAAMGAIS